MQNFKKSLLAVSTLALVAAPASAMPDTVAEMRQIISTEYGGDISAYVEEEHKDFRKMGCEGRIDLLQALLDDGLVLNDLSYRTHMRATTCAMTKEEPGAFSILLTPDRMTDWESTYFDRNVMSPLQYVIYENEYGLVRAMLENGVHQFANDDDYAVLTREEQLLIAANYALDAGKENAVRAFQDTGFGHLLTAARNEDNLRYVRARAGKGGGGGGGLFRAIAGGVAGAALGGTAGAAAGFLGAGTADDAEAAPQGTGPLPLATNRAELGVQFSAVTAPQRGIQVQRVLDGSPAALAGIAQGDVIISVAGMPVASRGSIYVATEKAFGAEEFEVEYVRNGETATAVLGKEPPEPEASAAEIADTGEATAASSDMSSKLEELDKLGDLRDRGILSDEKFETMKARILGGS